MSRTGVTFERKPDSRPAHQHSEFGQPKGDASVHVTEQGDHAE